LQISIAIAQLNSHSPGMPHFITNMMIPESLKTPAFRFTAVGLLLFIAITKPLDFSVDNTDDIRKTSYFYHLSVFIMWNLAGFVALASCEWKLQCVLFSRFVRERFLRAQSQRTTKIPPLEENHPISFDALMLIPYVYSVVAIIDSTIRTARGDQSEQRDIATIITRASFIWCCYAIYGDTLCRRDDQLGIYVHPTDLRMIAWFALLITSILAILFSALMGRSLLLIGPVADRKDL
jgi:hypothetical protein